MVGASGHHLRSTDLFALSIERDPLLRSTIVAVALLDRPPDWDVLLDRVDRATRVVPMFRQRPRPGVPGVLPSRWVTDPDFDLGFHLRRIAAPEPHTIGTVLDFARRAGMAAFDPVRPLWEFTLVEGLEQGRAAFVLKLHHALTDGIGGIQIAAHMVDLQREPADLGPLPPAPPVDGDGPLGACRDLVAHQAFRAAAAGARLGALPGGAWRALRDPVGAVRGSAATASSLARFVRPVTETRSPVMTDRRLGWRYDVLDVPFEPLRRATKAVGATLNDGFLAAVTGGLRRYHEHHGAPVDSLLLTMPISVRRDGDAEGGNRVTLVRFDVPVGIEDPVERVGEIGRRADAMRRERALPWSETVAGVLNLLPGPVTASMLKHIDVTATNVPGFRFPVYLGGAEITGLYAFGPTLGGACNIALMSYRDTCHIAVNTDVGAVPDPERFVGCLSRGFDEVLALGDGHAGAV